MNWNWLRAVLAPLDAFLYRRRTRQLEKLTVQLMAQLFEANREPHTAVDGGTNVYILGLYDQAHQRFLMWREQERLARKRQEPHNALKARVIAHNRPMYAIRRLP